MMRIWMLGMLALVASGAAMAQPEGGPQDRLPDLLVLDAASAAGLSEAQTVTVYQKFRAIRGQVQPLLRERNEVRKALAAGAGAADGDVAQQLDKLRQLDAQIHNIHSTGAVEIGAGLTPKQQAALYLVVSDMPGAIRAKRAAAAEAEAGDDPAPAPAAAAAAAAPAPAPAAAADPKADAMKLVTEWVASAKAKNIDAMMSVFSDKFTNPQYGDKEGIKDFLSQAMDMGYLDDLTVSLEDAEVEMEDGKASIYPVDVEGTFGSITIEFIAEQEGGVWKLTGLDISGI